MAGRRDGGRREKLKAIFLNNIFQEEGRRKKAMAGIELWTKDTLDSAEGANAWLAMAKNILAQFLEELFCLFRMPKFFLQLDIVTQTTFLRLPLAVLASQSIVLGQPELAVFFYVLASLTDAADGYLARTLGLGTEMGKTFDYMADKYLVILVLSSLTINGQLHPIFLILISFREAAVVALRLYSVRKGNSRLTEVDHGGKLKMIFQCVALSWTIVGFSCYELLMGFSVLLTYISFAKYLRGYWAELGKAKADCRAFWTKIKEMSVAS